MVESSISGAAYKDNSGTDPDFLLPSLMGGRGQYPICNLFGDLTVYQSAMIQFTSLHWVIFWHGQHDFPYEPAHNTALPK